VFDPCLSCATHALGKMPLEVELLIAEGARVDVLVRASDGSIGYAAPDVRPAKLEEQAA